MHNSFSTNNINSHSNRKLISDLMRNQNRIKNQLLNNENNSPDKLIKIWKDLCILEPYRELFNLLITYIPVPDTSYFVVFLFIAAIKQGLPKKIKIPIPTIGYQ